jgi:hypothetical protein
MPGDELAGDDAVFSTDTGMCCVWGSRYIHAAKGRGILGFCQAMAPWPTRCRRQSVLKSPSSQIKPFGENVEGVLYVLKSVPAFGMLI